MVHCLLPVSPDFPLVAAFALALPDQACGVWLEGAHTSGPVPVRLAAPGGWRTLLLGPDLGQLLNQVDSALVDAGSGPVRLSGAELRAARALEQVSGGVAHLIRLAGQTPESVLTAHSARISTRIRYIG